MTPDVTAGHTEMLLSLTRLTAHWTSLDYQRRVSDACGVTLDTAAVRAVYVLGIRGGSARPSVLAEELNLSRPSTSKLLARLSDAGLVERTRDEDDGRSTRIALGERGRAAFERLFDAGVVMIAQATADWDPADARALSELLPRFVAGLLQNPTPNH
ncbi:MarR family winged helix-turn-helix transcriptional regulator [Leucobacter luti]|uniref:MarR family winged helix-turn-helix transcriptional regulator n=1 Tax=Leucobacter luti TaxID=340320 RepID=UPI003D05EE83